VYVAALAASSCQLVTSGHLPGRGRRHASVYTRAETVLRARSEVRSVLSGSAYRGRVDELSDSSGLVTDQDGLRRRLAADALERVQALGGSVVHPGERWAICKDSEGSPFALTRVS